MWRKTLLISFVFVLFIAIGHVSCIVCYKCDSTTLEACAVTLDWTILPYLECPTDQQCAMSIVDSITYRGCFSSTPTIGATYKKFCSNNLCNKGVYPPGRLKCHHCTGSECATIGDGAKPNPCLNHNEDDQCYTQVLSLDHVNRGCRSDTNRTAADTLMDFCDYNGCNDRAALRKLICAQCDSTNGRGCKMDLSMTIAGKCNITQYETCEVDVPLTTNESCFIYHNLDRVVRGCTKYIPEDIQSDIEHRRECNATNFCNTPCLEQQDCIVCDSSVSKACRDDASTIPKSFCGSAEISSCFISEYKDWHIERGCGSPKVENSNINRYYECQGNGGCNAASLRRCYSCSSTADVNCANWERPGFSVEIEDCQDLEAACIIAGFSNGTIQRGCHSNTFNCDDLEELSSCVQCNGNFCNKGRYPPDRLRCYQCVGNEECAQIHYDPMPCSSASLDVSDACFEFYSTELGGTIRGCRSNAFFYYRCVLHEGGRGCKICYEDGCNQNLVQIESNL